MVGPLRPGPVTEGQLEELRRLATWPGLPAEAAEYVEQRIAEGLDRNTAYNLIGAYGRRIKALKDDPVGAMAAEQRRLHERGMT